MGLHLRSLILNAKQICKLNIFLTRNQYNVPRGHLTVNVGETEKKRFVVPLSYLSHPSFQELLRRAEEKFSFDHPIGGLTIPCKEDTFVDLTSRFNG
ncbi:hypothetical protein LguiA_009085 [Lonicera macranthoides]